MLILMGPHVKHFSDRNQAVCLTLENKSWPPIVPEQRENIKNRKCHTCDF
jgi:hypothetical protein